MTILALANSKGGGGKSTIAAFIAAELHRRKKPVSMLDAQRHEIALYKPFAILRLCLIASLFLATVGCSMFQRDKLTVRKDDAPQKAVVVTTGMLFIDVERLLGKPSKVSNESCRVSGETVECQVWRYSESRKSTLWFHGEEPRLVMFDLDAVR
jgi:hypothetical protein